MLLAIFTIPFLWTAWNAICLARNVRLARQTGLPFVVTPVFEFGAVMRLFSKPIAKLCSNLPFGLGGFTRVITPDWVWKEKYQIFKDMGSDIFVSVSPRKLLFYVADGAVAAEVMNRRVEFPKPIHAYKILEVFGRNVVTTEGHAWRTHRKITSPPFSEKNNSLVWSESLYQAKAMLSYWTSTPKKVVKTLAQDCMRSTLAVISYAGFGMKLPWENEHDSDQAEKPDHTGEGGSALQNGHEMSYPHALTTLLHNIVLLLLVPHAILRISPSAAHRTAVKAFYEWKNYCQELFESKKKQIELSSAVKEEAGGGGDLMGAMIKGAGLQPGEKLKGPGLSTEEIIGNTFIFIVAGHETTANTVHYALLLLAMHPEYQVMLQRELDKALGDKKEWSYEHDFPVLAEGLAGAILYETLRLFPPVVFIPKWTVNKYQTVSFQNRQIVIPPQAEIEIDTVALHRNPKYWVRPGQTEAEAAINEFRPIRWVLTEDSPVEERHDADLLEESHAPEGRASENNFFKPPRGAFAPFSEGFRACLGRRFAHVEFVAVLAVLFKEYSVELVVEDGKSWKDAVRDAWAKVENSGSILTLQPKGEPVQLVWVRRGSERFFPRD